MTGPRGRGGFSPVNLGRNARNQRQQHEDDVDDTIRKLQEEIDDIKKQTTDYRDDVKKYQGDIDKLKQELQAPPKKKKKKKWTRRALIALGCLAAIAAGAYALKKISDSKRNKYYSSPMSRRLRDPTSNPHTDDTKPTTGPTTGTTTGTTQPVCPTVCPPVCPPVIINNTCPPCPPQNNNDGVLPLLLALRRQALIQQLQAASQPRLFLYRRGGCG